MNRLHASDCDSLDDNDLSVETNVKYDERLDQQAVQFSVTGSGETRDLEHMAGCTGLVYDRDADGTSEHLLGMSESGPSVQYSFAR